MKKLFLCIILARKGSKGIKNKNIRNLNGHPLIAYTIYEAIKSRVFDEIIVSTDSKKIKNIALKYGARVPFVRPINLSHSKAKAVDCDLHALKYAEKKYKKKFDYIIELMCTNPFKTSLDIKKVALKQKKTNADSVIAVHKLEDHHPIRIKKIEHNLIKNFCLKEISETRRQDLRPFAYIRSGSIYSMRRDMLLKGVRYGTKKSFAYIIPNKRVVNIDEEMDLNFAQYLMTKINKKIKPLTYKSKKIKY